jgi:hypothetical protein
MTFEEKQKIIFRYNCNTMNVVKILHKEGKLSDLEFNRLNSIYRICSFGNERCKNYILLINLVYNKIKSIEKHGGH